MHKVMNRAAEGQQSAAPLPAFTVPAQGGRGPTGGGGRATGGEGRGTAGSGGRPSEGGGQGTAGGGGRDPFGGDGHGPSGRGDRGPARGDDREPARSGGRGPARGDGQGPAVARPAARTGPRPVPRAARSRPPGRHDPRRPQATAAVRAATGGDASPPRPTDLFADRLLAVLTGRRPVHSMLRHTAGGAYDELARLAERGPLRGPGPAPVVRDVGYCVPRPGAVEVFARIATGDRLSAMAFRLERSGDRRWRCTAVDLGPRPSPGSPRREN
ncbi:Rv3235 family protein [Streptomyces sp. JNUCC 64]